jgi:hypothetical protein
MAKREQSDTVQLNLRIKEPIRQKIEESARDHGVSMNAEMVDRIQKSFDIDGTIGDIFGSSQIFGIMKIIASTMNEMGRSEYYRSQRALDLGDRWLSDPYAYDEAMGAAVRVLEALRPKGEIVAPIPLTLPDGTVLSSRGIGAGTAQARMEYIAHNGRLPETDATGVDGKLIDRLRENLMDDEVAAEPKTTARGQK